MRKLRVALVILLLLAFFTVPPAVFGMSTIGPTSMGNAMSIGKTRATLADIEKKLATGSSNIAQENQLMTAWVKYKAGQNIGNVTRDLNASKGKTSIKPPSTRGMSVPMSGIGDAVKSLGNIGFSMKSPVSLAKSMLMPKLAILE